MLSERGRPHPPSGVDYYLFTRELYGELPPFAIGRTAYDNWLIFKARSLGVPVIDATRMVTCIHQNHERTYASIGLQAPLQGETDLRNGIEARRNLELAGGYDKLFTLADANWLLTSQGLIPAMTPEHRRRSRQTWLMLHCSTVHELRKTMQRLFSLLRRFPVALGHHLRRF